MKPQLVLSCFPGIGLLDRAFEEEGFCVVRGPDLLWGGDIKTFHPPAGVFDGVIGGPPCQAFSAMRHIVRALGHEPKYGNLIPEFERCVAEAQPEWFVMENVRGAPLPAIPGYEIDPTLLNNRWLGEKQNRVHRLSFGSRDGRKLHYELAALECTKWEPRVLTGSRDSSAFLARSGAQRNKRHILPNTGRSKSIEDMCELQGLPRDTFAHSPFTRASQRAMLGNAVPLPMGRAIAKAVRRALEEQAA